VRHSHSISVFFCGTLVICVAFFGQTKAWGNVGVKSWSNRHHRCLLLVAHFLLVTAWSTPTHAGIGKVIAGLFDEFAGFMRAAPTDDAIRAAPIEQVLPDALVTPAQKSAALNRVPRVDLHGPRYRYSHQIIDDDSLEGQSVKAFSHNASPIDYDWLKFYLAARTVSVMSKEIEKSVASTASEEVTPAYFAPGESTPLAVKPLGYAAASEGNAASEIAAFLATVADSQEASPQEGIDHLGYVLDKLEMDKQLNEALSNARTFARRGLPFDQVSVEAARVELEDGTIDGNIHLADSHLAICADLRSVAYVDWPEIDLTGEIIHERKGETFSLSRLSTVAGEATHETFVLQRNESGGGNLRFEDNAGGETSVWVGGEVLTAFDEAERVSQLLKSTANKATFVRLSSEIDTPTEHVQLDVIERRDGLALVKKTVGTPPDNIASTSLVVYDIEAGVILLTDMNDGVSLSWVETASLEITQSACID
jgi:hypothetical protein